VETILYLFSILLENSVRLLKHLTDT